jgi:hypothetical protein
MSQSFADFRTAIRDLVTIDGARHGVSLGSAKYFDRMITAALLDLQSYVPQLRERHREVFKEFDLTQEGEASVGTVPEGVITDAYYISTATCPCTSRPFVPYPFESRMDLFCGKPRITGRQYFLIVDPFGDKFIVFPKVTPTSAIWLYWSGTKGAFGDSDVVRFGDEEAQAVAYYVKSHIAREVDKDLVLAGSYWQSYAGNASMMGIRTRLHLDWKRRAEGPPAFTSPQPEKAGACDCTGPMKCCWEGGDCGFFEGFLYLLGPDELYHKITIAGAVGHEAFVIGAGIAAPTWDACVTPEAAGYGFFGGFFHIWNSTLEDFMSITITGSGAEAAIELGPRKADMGSISASARAYRFDDCLKVLNRDTGEFCSLNLLEEA